MWVVFLKGFTLALSLIFAIGAQNAFVLRQGIKKEHIFLTVNFCTLSDIVGISLGFFFFVQLSKLFEDISFYISVLGIVFLLGYGAFSMYAVTKNQVMQLGDKSVKENKLSIILKLTGVTFLNPHYYLDTVFLIGSQASAEKAFPGLFILGCITACFSWFYSLGYASGFLRNLFSKALSWKILNFLIACIMWYIAYDLYIGIIEKSS